MNKWRRCRSYGLVAGGVLVLLSLMTGAGHAQDDSGLPLAYVSRNPAIIAGQVQMAIEQERRALSLLPSAADKASLAALHDLVYQSYVLVRYAVAGVEGIRAKSRYPNPLLKTQLDMMEVTRAQLRESLRHIAAAQVGQRDRIPAAVTHLRRALDHLQSAAELM